MELSVLNTTGEETGRTVSLAENIFDIEPNQHAVYLDVKQYLANQRQGTHKTKERSEIVGSTRKLHRQKGTGSSRKGSIKNPLFRGGGRIFGPRPRSYSFKVNRKVKALARKSALSFKAKESAIKVLEDFTLKVPKTKDYLSILNALTLADHKTLLILSDNNKNIYLSSRNIPKAKVTTVDELNTYDLVHADTIILIEEAVGKLESIFKA
ncbi:MAG: 50S ribosomal protein L4 [Thermonemataceae bacterium]